MYLKSRDIILLTPAYCDVQDKLRLITSYLYSHSLYFLVSLTLLEAMQGMHECFFIRTSLFLVSFYWIKTSGKRNLFEWFVLFFTACIYSCVFNQVLEIGMIKSPWVPDVVQRYNSQLLFFTIDPLDTIIPHTLGNLKLESKAKSS